VIAFLTALPAILGALAGMVPAVIGYFSLKANNAQALAMATLQLEATKIGGALQVDIKNVEADIQQSSRIYDFANGLSGNKFIDALAVFIRPFVTLIFLFIWLLMKVGLFVYGVNSGYDMGQLVKLLWASEDQAIFGAIMGFWFGNRMLLRSQQQMPATIAITQKGK